jgi:hypothetical protein
MYDLWPYDDTCDQYVDDMMMMFMLTRARRSTYVLVEQKQA